MRPAIFLDRDGVINRKKPEGEYVSRWQEFEFLPGALDAIRRFVQKRIPVFVVTNQRGVARGGIAEGVLSDIHARMSGEFEKSRAALSGIYTCTHDEGGCGCRKPMPGLLLRAAGEHGIDLARSYMIGDSASDIEAGRRAGTYTILLTDNPLRDHSGKLVDADFWCATLGEAVDLALAEISRASGTFSHV